MNKTSKDKIEKMYLWLGASLGIVVSILTIYDHANNKSPANLDVKFSYNLSSRINFAPYLESNQVNRNDYLPFDLMIQNTGDLTARNVELSFICPELMTVVSEKYVVEWKKIIINEEKKNLFTLQLNDINPYSSIYTSNELYFSIRSNNNGPSNDENNNMHSEISNMYEKYSLECMTSCDNIKVRKTNFQFVIADSSYFNKNKLSYYLIKENEIYIVTYNFF